MKAERSASGYVMMARVLIHVIAIGGEPGIWGEL